MVSVVHGAPRAHFPLYFKAGKLHSHPSTFCRRFPSSLAPWLPWKHLPHASHCAGGITLTRSREVGVTLSILQRRKLRPREASLSRVPKRVSSGEGYQTCLSGHVPPTLMLSSTLILEVGGLWLYEDEKDWWGGISLGRDSLCDGL